MAGDWIKMRSNLRRHPKVVRLASASNADRLRVVGGLHAVWCLFDEHSEDGCLYGYTPSAIDEEIGWPGFCDLLIAIGWVESDGNDGLSLPDFDTHNGASAKRRAMEADRKRAERAVASDDTHHGGNVSASDADKKRTREEKRREEETPSASLPGFDRFWNAWPKSTRKEARGKCLDAWRKAKAEGHADLIIAHVESKKLTTDWAKESGRFIEAPLVYLNQRRWEGAESEDTASADRIGSFI
jgi:hypothetical protein